MSSWTHVNGIVRLDGILSMGKPEVGKMYLPYLTETKMYDSMPGDREKLIPHCTNNPDECIIPKGSEGSLKVLVHQEAGNGMPLFVVSIWGDLRDYDEHKPILEYVETHVIGQFIVRSAIIEIQTESESSIYAYYHNYGSDNIEGEWVKVY